MRLTLSIVSALCLAQGVYASDPVLLPVPHPIRITPFLAPELHTILPEATATSHGLKLEPTQPHHWLADYSADAPALFALQVHVDERYDDAILTVWDWDNQAVFQQTITNGKEQTITFQLHGLGSYLLTLDARSQGAVTQRLIRNVAVTRDLNQARDQFIPNEFFLGICAFPGRYHWAPNGVPVRPLSLDEDEARQLEAHRLARLGFQVVRVDESMEMGLFDPEQPNGSFQFDYHRMDAAVDAYVSRGFDLALQLMHAPDWAIHPKYANVVQHRWRYPHEERAQRAYVEALLKRYGHHARFVQIFNEPDQSEFWAGEPAEFVESFRYTHEVIRTYSPHLPVANGGYAFVDDQKVEYFAEALQPWVDFPSYHSHGPLRGMVDAFGRMKSLQQQAGSNVSQILNTETGFDVWRLDQERRQAQAVAQKVLYAWAHDHRGILLFCGRMIKAPGREGRDLGLLDYHFCPRFSYAAIAGLVDRLAGASFDQVLREEDDEFVYLFRRGEDLIVTAFTLGEERLAHVSSDSEEATLFDAMGNRVRSSKDGISFTLSAYPQYIVLKRATAHLIQWD